MSHTPGPDPTPPPSTQVVEAVATTLDVPSTQLTAPLHDAIDTDALDALFTRPHPPNVQPLEVRFTYQHLDVLVTTSAVDGIEIRVDQLTAGGLDSTSTTRE